MLLKTSQVLAALAVAASLCVAACGDDGSTEPDPEVVAPPDVEPEPVLPGSDAAPCSVELHLLGDLASHTRFIYEDGNKVAEERDFDGDGNLDRRIAWIYEDRDLPTRREVDTNGDGTVDELVYLEHDGQGRLIGEMFDRGSDGELDGMRSYRFNGFDQLVEIEYDADYDGFLEESTVFLYDELGQLIEESTWPGDAKQPEAVRTYTYDYRGNLSLKREELGSQQQSHVIETRYRYDGQSRLIREELDVNADRDLDQIYSYSYEGSLPTQVELDRGANNDVDELTVFEHDEMGRLTATIWDRNADGTPEEREDRTYGCY